MSAKAHSRISNWLEDLGKMHWSPKHAERSAKLALSKAVWLGINKECAIQHIFEMGVGGFFQANPHLPYETWQTVVEQIESQTESGDLLAAV